jgi:hypothetical protein
MIQSYWVMPCDPGNDIATLGMTINQASRRWRVENWPATQFADYELAKEYAIMCRLAGLEAKIVPSADVYDERAYREYRMDLPTSGPKDK